MVWTLENLPERLAAIRSVAERFTQATGITVELVAVAEDQFNQVLTSNAAAGDLPDVIGALPLGAVRTLSSNELIDTGAVGRRGRPDAEPSATAPSSSPPTATPNSPFRVSRGSSCWSTARTSSTKPASTHRPPTTRSPAAAKRPDSSDMAGFVGANVAGDAFTEQTFEEIGLGNNCQLVNDSGDVTFDSPECVEGLNFYGDLQQNYSVTGAQDVDTTRAAYFAGKAAMVIWSSFILDEMAGLRNDATAELPRVQGDPAFLAKNSGVVTSIQGPSGTGAGHSSARSRPGRSRRARTPTRRRSSSST